jgi:hypothetical protein
MKLSELASLLGTRDQTQKLRDGSYLAELDDIWIEQPGGIIGSATGFGRTRPLARRSLAAIVHGKTLRTLDGTFRLTLPMNVGITPG